VVPRGHHPIHPRPCRLDLRVNELKTVTRERVSTPRAAVHSHNRNQMLYGNAPPVCNNISGRLQNRNEIWVNGVKVIQWKLSGYVHSDGSSKILQLLEWRADLAGGHRSATGRTVHFFLSLPPPRYVAVFPLQRCQTRPILGPTHKDFMYVYSTSVDMRKGDARVSRQTRFQPRGITARGL